jgi:hypothetical protein
MINDLLVKSIIFLYAASGIVSTIAYIPTIKDLWLHKKMSANVSSYVLWTTTSFITLLYSVFVLQDALFRIISALTFISCGLILILALGLSYRNKFSK